MHPFLEFRLQQLERHPIETEANCQNNYSDFIMPTWHMPCLLLLENYFCHFFESQHVLLFLCWVNINRLKFCLTHNHWVCHSIFGHIFLKGLLFGWSTPLIGLPSIPCLFNDSVHRNPLEWQVFSNMSRSCILDQSFPELLFFQFLCSLCLLANFHYQNSATILLIFGYYSPLKTAG